ncbi:hypothetical protein KL942_004359 [Ogataea angusta]|uniref:Dihydrodipicolinate synthetase n=1 Tax=Pichia angusta TaxID=870730 RepID=A0ABQ7RU86_PICAN|nr:hypothetical protein KL909_004216 [Ogataea angusta]KAG7837471.1 hypothetical protein KL942_004359 [Ogataea angusta]KAG7847580.1 hypothetical protein KL940_003492 [Ogataea angusta]
MTLEKTLKDGIYSPVPTFFKTDAAQSLDTATQQEHARLLYHSGISGILVGGSTGEAVHLPLEERAAIVKSVRDAVPNSSFKILAGGVGSCVPELCHQAAVYKENGADMMIVLVPGYYGPAITTQSGLEAWFHDLADNSPLPIVVYNYPGVQNGIDLTGETFTRIGMHKNIVGCKLTNFNFPLYTMLGQNERLKASDFTPLSGVGQVLVPSLSVNVNGAIDGFSNVFPKCLVRIMELYKSHRYKEALELQDMIARINELTAATNLVGLKYALKYKYGLGETEVGRPPLNHSMDMDAWKKHLPLFEQLSKIEDSL